MTSQPRYILSIQSHVAMGHVGNAAAVFPLQRLGFEVLPVHTVQFSNHTGYGQYRGQVFEAEHVREVLEGLRERGVLGQVEAVLSGYLGEAAIGAQILRTVNEIRRENPHVRYLCDPVMGDVGRGVFVNQTIPEFMRNLAIPCADILTPNQFEAELLTGSRLRTVDEAVNIARQLRRRGPDTIVVTSLTTEDIPGDQLGTLAVDGSGAWLVLTPRLELYPMPNGMGDVFSATLLGRLMISDCLPDALSKSTSTLYNLVKATKAGSRDLPLIQAQEQLASPNPTFDAQPV
ncbi:pyridoxal kinase PdxY [Pseudomonas sp. DCB_AW]|uniref:pyridoxal kinase PdxY n=1 Tax=Pseudomonas sp. DCB_AW TaxID=2993596 RepID=UPI0022493610|nr:pyridoxal kinase PdxY [Pseudomonas sp. DCB_AW]MCX2684696.1 pyridoxal kinase PdxY [Pseudomonas sp. DCB_AW]